MDEMKVKLAGAVAAKLTAAPQSADKEELIEELSDNLYRRFLDMTSAGMDEEAAFQRSMDDLGDVDELLAYLGVEPPAQDADVTIDQKGSQTRITTGSGQTVIINSGDGEPITINSGDGGPITISGAQKKADTAQERADAAQAEADAAQKRADVAQAEADAAQKRADAVQDTEGADIAQEEADTAQEEADAAQEKADTAQGEAGAARGGWRDERGDIHYDSGTQAPQSDLDAILANVGEVCRIAMEQVKDAAKQAKEAIQRRTTVQRDNGHVKVHFNAGPSAPVPPAPPTPSTPPAPPTPPTPPAPPSGWEFEAELDSDQGRFFAGAGPRKRKDVIYGFGYDKAKGGFFAQWGEYQGEYHDEDREGRGPHFSGVDAAMEHQDDGSYSVSALKDLRGIEVHTNAGDVAIHVSEAPDAGVIIDGDVDDLDVTCSADGVLTIREGRTASSSFFSRRGIGSADVELFLPRRHWDMITVSTASGDVDIDRDRLDVDYLTVSTASGDLSVRLRACCALSFKSASGDLDLDGTCTGLLAETMSGDITLRGQVEDARLKSTSGDIELEGLVRRFQGGTMSGDVSVETSVMPEAVQMSSKSGDCKVRLPDAGPFSVRLKTVTGEMDCAFPVNYVNGVCVYGDGSGPAYSITTVSGDVSLKRY